MLERLAADMNPNPACPMMCKYRACTIASNLGQVIERMLGRLAATDVNRDPACSMQGICRNWMSTVLQVVERVLERLAADVNRDPACPVLGVVRLNGIVHAEERAAFREIARQLCTCATLAVEGVKVARVGGT